MLAWLRLTCEGARSRGRDGEGRDEVHDHDVRGYVRARGQVARVNQRDDRVHAPDRRRADRVRRAGVPTRARRPEPSQDGQGPAGRPRGHRRAVRRVTGVPGGVLGRGRRERGSRGRDRRADQPGCRRPDRGPPVHGRTPRRRHGADQHLTADAGVENLLRELAPQVLGVLVRRDEDFAGREDAVAALEAPDQAAPSGQDDSLALLLMCCHPMLPVPSQLALTLRAVGGLTTSEIARAFLVPEATMAKRISRAKQQLRSAGVRFDLPPAAEWAGRLQVVLHVLYLVFSEGYTSTSGPDLQRADLTTEAIRLARLLHQLIPADGEVAGLLALMLLTDARRTARTTADGSLVPLAEQRRDLWDTARIQEGVALLTRTLGTVPVGPYQLQAAIAAVHDEAPGDGETDWPQILALYQALELVAPGPAVTLNRAVAVAMANGPRAGLAVLGTLDADDRMTHTHRLEAVRAHLLERAGDLDAARLAYQRAARMTTNLPEQRYLTLRAARLS